MKNQAGGDRSEENRPKFSLVGRASVGSSTGGSSGDKGQGKSRSKGKSAKKDALIESLQEKLAKSKKALKNAKADLRKNGPYDPGWTQGGELGQDELKVPALPSDVSADIASPPPDPLLAKGKVEKGDGPTELMKAEGGEGLGQETAKEEEPMVADQGTKSKAQPGPVEEKKPAEPEGAKRAASPSCFCRNSDSSCSSSSKSKARRRRKSAKSSSSESDGAAKRKAPQLSKVGEIAPLQMAQVPPPVPLPATDPAQIKMQKDHHNACAWYHAATPIMSQHLSLTQYAETRNTASSILSLIEANVLTREGLFLHAQRLMNVVAETRNP
jgi:hypothetical protein